MIPLLALAFAVALAPGLKLDLDLSAAESHVYSVKLESGAALIGRVQQQGIDVAIDVYAPDGAMTRFDSPNGAQGPEPIDYTALAGGTYRVEIHAVDRAAAPGKYTLEIGSVVPPGENAARLMKASLPSATLFELWQQSTTDPAAIDRFFRGRKGRSAVLETVPVNAAESRVIYVVEGDADTERVLFGGGPEFGVLMRRLGRTNLFFGTQIVPNDARFEVSLTLREVHHAGPHGEVEVVEAVPAGSWLLEMPDAPRQPDVVAAAEEHRERVVKSTIRSNALGEDRDVAVYTPRDYAAQTPCNLLIVFDGGTYGASEQAPIPTPAILDNLIAARKIGPTIAVFVLTMGKRNRDLTGNAAFAAFVAEELVPWARAHYAIEAGPRAVAVAGSSFGGFAASYTAMLHPDVVGNVISLSGAYWITRDWQSVRPPYPHDTGMLIEELKSRARLPVRFYIEVGRFDLGAAMLGANRELRDVLQVKGYEVEYREFDGGHDVAQWRGSLSDGLVATFGRGAPRG